MRDSMTEESRSIIIYMFDHGNMTEESRSIIIYMFDHDKQLFADRPFNRFVFYMNLLLYR